MCRWRWHLVRTYVLVEMAAGHSRSLVEAVEGMDGAKDVVRVTGPYDVIVVLEADGVDEISDIVSRRIHSMTGVVRTTTCVSVG